MTTALYRRYRPETFAEVIGQDHVTAPLRQALRSGQVNHAYLFSGPRGCGKTTSARILARILNCAQNTEASPTDTPCGECPSCIELARGGPGSLDVVEIDAASHGGVDDARELRERATFAPARDRFKIFILDEAHMVSNQGFNALLKIVEEPPPHVKFVFATTEPDKVIGTIRSRTHHYPFRLVPPDVLLPYLEQLCEAERVPVGGGVLPLVVRAGGGSVRDTLSVLDQLIAGSDASGIDYEGAAALLGYTQASLLDDLVDAIAARDGGAAFRVVERVIATGHEPRRFVEDLLERLRDLIVIDAAGEAAGAALRGLPEDQLATMRVQAARLGAAELSRSADLANAALTEMTGATSPRLHLELLMARLLLPAADDAQVGLAARLDRLERGLPAGATSAALPSSALAVPVDEPAPAAPAAPPTAARGAASARAALAAHRAAQLADAPPAEGSAPSGAPHRPAEPATPVPATPSAPAAPAGSDERADTPQVEDSTSRAAREPVSTPAAPVSAPDVPTEVTEPDSAQQARGASGGDEPPEAPAGPQGGERAPAVPDAASDDEPDALGGAPGAEPEDAPFVAVPAAAHSETETLRRRWPEVLDTVRSMRRVTGALVDPHNAQVAELDATTLRLSFTTPELANAFRNGPHADVVSRAVHETLGFQVRVEATSGDARTPSPAEGGQPAPRAAQAQPGGRAPRLRPSTTTSTGEGDDEEAHRGGRPGRPAGSASAAGAPSADAPDTGAPPGVAPAGVASADLAPADAGQAASTSAPTVAAAAPAAQVSSPVLSDWEPPEEPDDPWASSPPEPKTRAPAAPHSPADPAAAPEPAPRPHPVPGVISPEDAAASWDLPPTGRPAARPTARPADERPAASTPPARERSAAAESAVARAQRLAANAPRRHAPAPRSAAPAAPADPYLDASPDDPDVASSGLVGAPLVAQILGGTVIDEQVDDGR